MNPILVPRPEGLYCPAGDFYIDPSRSVDRAVITHAHSDHARRGAASYLCHSDASGPLRVRLGKKIHVQCIEYGEELRIGSAKVSLHPAGHILGSAQVSVAVDGEVWGVSGDYKTTPDGLCAAYEPVPCRVFISETTFGLPVYQWPDERKVLDAFLSWWAFTAESDLVAVASVYSLGKAQRLIHSCMGRDLPGPLMVHPVIHEINLSLGSAFPFLGYQLLDPGKQPPSGALVIAPHGYLPPYGNKTAFAQLSGWFRTSKRTTANPEIHGFCLSDHADWPGLLNGIYATGCEQVLLYHGNTEALCRYLNDLGLSAKPFGQNPDPFSVGQDPAQKTA